MYKVKRTILEKTENLKINETIFIENSTIITIIEYEKYYKNISIGIVLNNKTSYEYLYIYNGNIIMGNFTKLCKKINDNIEKSIVNWYCKNTINNSITVINSLSVIIDRIFIFGKFVNYINYYFKKIELINLNLYKFQICSSINQCSKLCGEDEYCKGYGYFDNIFYLFKYENRIDFKFNKNYSNNSFVLIKISYNQSENIHIFQGKNCFN